MHRAVRCVESINIWQQRSFEYFHMICECRACCWEWVGDKKKPQRAATERLKIRTRSEVKLLHLRSFHENPVRTASAMQSKISKFVSLNSKLANIDLFFRRSRDNEWLDGSFTQFTECSVKISSLWMKNCDTVPWDDIGFLLCANFCLSLYRSHVDFFRYSGSNGSNSENVNVVSACF